MSDPDYIVQVTVLSGDGKQKLLEWEMGAMAKDSLVQERMTEGVSEAEAVALCYVHTYDVMGNPPQYIHPTLRESAAIEWDVSPFTPGG